MCFELDQALQRPKYIVIVLRKGKAKGGEGWRWGRLENETEITSKVFNIYTGAKTFRLAVI